MIISDKKFIENLLIAEKSNNWHTFTSMDFNKKELINQLRSKGKGLENWFLDRPLESMDFAPEGAWTAGQHLHHLMKSTKPLAVGMGYPRILAL